MEDENVSIDGSNSDSPTTSNEATNKELLIESQFRVKIICLRLHFSYLLYIIIVLF